METYRIILRRLANAAFFVYSSIGKQCIRISGTRRPLSAPYLSGDGFRLLADHILDETQPSLDLPVIDTYDRIFVSGAYIRTFFEKYHAKIRVPYILMTHNGDECVDKSYRKYLSGHLVRWYAQNVKIRDKKIIPIPIGLENLYHYNHGIPWMYKKNVKTKQMKIVYGFTTSTNRKEREYAEKCLRHCAVSVKLSGYYHSLKYTNVLARYGFVASPSGNGLDCHRTWEALYLGVIPIVKRSVAMEFFVSLGLPIYCVDDWKEVEKLTEKQLLTIYRAKKSGFRSPILWFSYWQKRIKKRI